MQQIGDIKLVKQWKRVDIPVLVIYGTSNPATSADESHYLVNLINSFHPGRAAYVELPGMGHDFFKYDSQLEFLTRGKNPTKQHNFDDALTGAIIKSLSEQLQA
jgi:hypothetical protein